jgi:tetrapyrrole methylase family protein/MazG family protein
MRRRFPSTPNHEFSVFVKTVRRLRRECPWDRQQTHHSLRMSLIEEAYEVLEALDEKNLEELRHELGDLLLHVVMHATIAEEAGEFSLRDVIEDITRKLVRRHPHIFGSARSGTAQEIKRRWEILKMQEGRTSMLQGVPRGMPALQRALRIQERAAKVGFDWERREQVWKKVIEEVEELKERLHGGRRGQREEELGDYLFALVNYSRFLRINPETALRRTTEKFIRRFQHIERSLQKQGKQVHTSTLEEMDALWNEAKRKRLRKGPSR